MPPVNQLQGVPPVAVSPIPVGRISSCQNGRQCRDPGTTSIFAQTAQRDNGESWESMASAYGTESALAVPHQHRTRSISCGDSC